MAKKLYLTKFLTTASTLAMIGGMVDGALGAGVVSQQDPSAFNTAIDWDVARILVDQDAITLGGNRGITADLPIYIEDIVAAANTLKALNIATANVQIGDITMSGGTAGQIDFTLAGSSVTLVGGDRNDRTSAADYSGVNGINFSSAGTLIVDTNLVLNHDKSGNVAGAGDAITIAGAVTSGANGTLNVNTGLNVSDGSWLGVNSINIGTAGAAATLTANLTAASSVDGSKVTFKNSGSTLSLNTTQDIGLSNSLGGATDVSGDLTINPTTNNIAINDTSNGSIGVSNTERLSTLSVGGTKTTTINVPVYAKYIQYGTSAASQSLIFNAIVDGGASSSLTSTNANATQVTFNENATIATIDFNGNAGTVSVANGRTLTTGAITDGGLDLSNGGIAVVSGNITGNITLKNSASCTIGGDTDGAISANDATTKLVFSGAGTSAGSIVATGQVIVQASRTFSNATLLMPQITLEGSNTDLTLTLANMGALQATTTETDRSQDVIVNVNQTIAGTIGSKTNPFGNVVLNQDITASIKTVSFYAGVTTNTNNTGTVSFDTDGSSALNLGDATNSLQAVNFNENASVAGDTYATTITIADAKTASLGGNCTGTIEAGVASSGTLTFTDSSVVTGTVGATTALDIINANGDANSAVTFSSTVAATTLNIGAGTVTFDSSAGTRNFSGVTNFTSNDGGKLLITTANATTISGNIAATTSDRGIVEVAAGNGAAVTFSAKVGDDASGYALKLLDVKGASTVKFNSSSSDVHISKINLDADATISFAQANRNYKIDELTTVDGNGTLYISEHTVFKSNGSTINLGTSDARIRQLQFRGTQNLTIEDGVNIYTNILTDTKNSGTLIFSGTSTLDIESGSGTISTINLNDDANLTLSVPSGAGGSSITLGDNTTLTLKNSFSPPSINSNNGSNGTLIFSNPSSMTLTSVSGIGKTKTLSAVEFAGTDVIIAGTVYLTNGTFKFTGSNAMSVTFNSSTDVGNATFINTSGATHTVVLKKATTTFSQDLATSTSNQLNFQLKDSTNAVVTGGNMTGTNFTTSADGKGELTLNNSGVTVNTVGASSLALSKLTFTDSGTVTNGTYASEISIADGKTATLGGTIASSKFSFVSSTAQVTFADGANINSNVVGDSSGGIVNFAGSSTIGYDIGSESAALTKVTFADDVTKTATLEGDVYATNIIINKGAVTLADNVNLTGATAMNSTSLNLDSYSLKHTGNLAVSGTNTVTFDMTDAGANSAIAGGTISSTSIMNFSNGTILILKPQDTNITENLGQSRQFVVASASSLQGISTEQIQVVQNNKNLKWKTSVSSTGITLVEDWGAKLYLQNIGIQDPKSIDAIDQLSAAAVGSPGEKMKDLLVELAKVNNVAKVKEALYRVTEASDSSADARSDIMSDIGDALSSRILTLDAISLGLASSNDNMSGVAAGDITNHIGAWASPFYGKTTQGNRSDLPGYTNEAYGASFGLDTRLSDDAIIGAAITASNSNIRHKSSKSGDKTRMNSLLFSIYGLTSLSDSAFLMGSTTISKNKVQNYSRRVASANDYEMARSKYNANSFSIKAVVGNNIATKKSIVTPMLGLKYSRAGAVHYKESGTSFQNLEISAKPQSKFDAVAGIKTMGVISCAKTGVMIIPEAHGFVDYSLSHHSSRQSVKLEAVEFVSVPKKPSRLKYNLGVGINSDYDGMEYSASYDLNLSDKLVGHQGALKVRVNF
jgi:outer membrane autotransporter protein